VENSNEVLLEVDHIKKYFVQKAKRSRTNRRGKVTVKAVDDVSFTIMPGEALGLIGESGCGKTTVSRVVMNLIKPTEGRIIFKGTEVDKHNIMAFRRSVQMVFQDPYASLDPKMSIREIVEEPLRVHTRLSKKEMDAVVIPVMERIGLTAEDLEKYPHEFSGGQRQRIGIARALVTKPDLLVCDEPVSALDVSIQASILNLFKTLQQDLGLAYLFISHDMSVERHMADRIAVMYLGRIVELAETEELFSNTLHPYTMALMKSIPVPDPRQKISREYLKGEPPSPISPPSGCPFHERCAFATQECEKERPAFRDAGGGHCVACHHWQSIKEGK
jgi:oligopeptide/dipeptide ABC transporter ATP-binding protein